MKKIKLLTFVFLLNYVNAQDVSIDKTELDYSKDEIAKVSITGSGINSVGHSISYDLTNNIIYLDVNTLTLDFIPTATYINPVITSNDYYRFFDGSSTYSKDITLVVRTYENEEEPNTIATFPLYLKKSITKGNTAITDPSGAWYEPSLSGTGFFIMQYGNGTQIWYNGYDAEGQPLWLSTSVINETWVAGEPKTFVVYEGAPDDMTNFTTPPANAPGITEWGSLQLQFDTCTTGSATITGADGTQTYQLEKLANPINVNCLSLD